MAALPPVFTNYHIKSAIQYTRSNCFSSVFSLSLYFLYKTTEVLSGNIWILSPFFDTIIKWVGKFNAIILSELRAQKTVTGSGECIAGF